MPNSNNHETNEISHSVRLITVFHAFELNETNRLTRLP